uniref:Uncharacterized protein n=1 Tax=Euplotes crassus TaxID=5936 RepID=A0A7S3NR54_EUPCR|mmetsp:Transcript_2313/g.2190  ORF Transcript_2313/g.2190 Transcript_2313/m.2190 type:complete len:127 (+) Transcript_2313:65-445(+)
MIKILRKQMNYLLLKDKDFNEALEDLPYLAVGIPNLEPDSDEHHEKSMDHEEPIKSADKEDVQNLDMSALKSSSKILPMTSFFRVIPDQALENFERHTNLHNLNNPMNPRMARYFPQEEPGLVKKL